VQFLGKEGPAEDICLDMLVDILNVTQQGQHWYSADANWRVLVGGTDCRHLVNTIELSVWRLCGLSCFMSDY